MKNILAFAIYHKYKDDPIKSQFHVTGPNWYDVEILKDDGNGFAIPHETQLTKEEVETAIDEYIVKIRANPKLNDPPEPA
tara:strand:+ start:685 stop:924 length:240 start_codon:yes stop_codon:yes gene_type:complete